MQRASTKMRPARRKNPTDEDHRDCFRAVMFHFTICIFMVWVILAGLLALTSLGDIFHSITKWFGAFGAMNSCILHVIPCDVRIKMMSFGLLFEQSFEFRQFLGVLFSQVNSLCVVLVQVVELPGVFRQRVVCSGRFLWRSYLGKPIRLSIRPDKSISHRRCSNTAMCDE